MENISVIIFYLTLLSLFIPANSVENYECGNGFSTLQEDEQGIVAVDNTTSVHRQNSFMCYKLFRDPVSWAEANDTCAKENAFLPMMTKKFLPLLSSGSFNYWVGLTKIYRQWQWISWPPHVFEKPMYPEVDAYWGLRFSDNFTTPNLNCAYLNIGSGILLTDDCETPESKHPHYCVNFGINPNTAKMEQGIDFDVILESNGKLRINSSNGDRFPILNCRVQIYNLKYSDVTEEYFDIVWVKNGIYLPHERSFSVDLNFMQWSSKRQFQASSESQFNTLNLDGMYWCEVSQRGQRPWHMSNKLDVAFADYEVISLVIDGTNPTQSTTQSRPTIIESSFLPVLDFIFNVSSEYSAVSSSMRSLDVYQAYLYFKRNSNPDFYYSIENAKKNIWELHKNRTTNDVQIKDIVLSSYYFCPNFTEISGDGYIYWERTAGGDVAVSSPPCFFMDDERIFTRKCNFDFENGSVWEDIPKDIGCYFTGKKQVILDGANFSDYESSLKGKCEEGFVSISSHQDYCVSNSIQAPLTYVKALQFCRSRNADLPGPMLLDKQFWLDHYDKASATWTTLSYQKDKFQWNTLFESKFINNRVTLEGVPDYSQEFCTVSDFTNQVRIQPKPCSDRYGFFCIKMVDTISSASQCPNGWMTRTNGNGVSSCWNGTIFMYREEINGTCLSIDDIFEKDITTILPGSQLLEASKKTLNRYCEPSVPFGRTEMAVFMCDPPSTKNANVAICLRNPMTKRPSRVVIGLHGDSRKLLCKGYNINSAFRVRWYFNNGILYDAVPSQINDRGLESIIEPKIHQQGYYKCEMWSADPLTSIVSPEILFQFPNISNDVSPIDNNDPLCMNAANIYRQPNRIDKMHISLRDGNPIKLWRAFPANGDGASFCNVLLISKLDRVDQPGVALGNASWCRAEQGDFSRAWPSVQSGSIAVPSGICLYSNGEPMIRRCLGDFRRGAHWQKDNFPPCQKQRRSETVELKKLSQITIREDNINKVASNLTSLTQNASNIENIDLHYIASTLENLATSDYLEKKHVKEAFQTLENVLLVDNQILSRAQSQMSTSVRITSALERVVQSSSTGEDQKINFTTSNAAVLKTEIYKRGYVYTNEQSISNVSSNSEIINFDPVNEIEYIDFKSSEAVVILPKDLQVTYSDAHKPVASLIVYKNSKLFFESNIANDSLHNVTNYVVSISVQGHSDTRWFNDPLQIYLEKTNSKAKDKLKCVFLDTQVASGAQWSQLGCKYNGTKYGKIVCLCDHMTDFSAMMELKGYDIDEIHETTLQVITYVGIACSDIGLLFIILTYMCHRKWRTGNMHHTIFNFAIALIFSLTAYLLIDKLYRWKIACITLAAILHYFLLASFCWMVVEGILQYLRFVRIIGTYIPRFMLKVCTFAWGLPIIPVATILALNTEWYINEDQERCWMTYWPLLYGFIIPISLCLLVNLILFLCIIHNLAKCKSPVAPHNYSGGKQSKSSGCLPMMSEFDWRRFTATVSIIVLLGLTWVFGLVVMDNYGVSTLVSKYCFTIVNSFQGFFIFLLQLTMDSSVKELWRAKKIIGINPADDRRTSSEDLDLSDVETRFRRTRKHMAKVLTFKGSQRVKLMRQ